MSSIEILGNVCNNSIILSALNFLNDSQSQQDCAF